jgi:copper chaperone CopZ
MRLQFKVNGMTCAACSARVEKVSSQVAGVQNAEVNLLAGTMVAEVDNLDAREIFWISELNTLNSAFGYNLKTGGEGGASSYIVSQEMHDAIIADLQHSELTEVDIAKKFGLKSAKTVYTINQGCHWLSSSKYQYPIRDTALIKSIGQAATRLKDPRTPWVRLYRMADSKHQNIEEDEFDEESDDDEEGDEEDEK